MGRLTLRKILQWIIKDNKKVGSFIYKNDSSFKNYSVKDSMSLTKVYNEDILIRINWFMTLYEQTLLVSTRDYKKFIS